MQPDKNSGVMRFLSETSLKVAEALAKSFVICVVCFCAASCQQSESGGTSAAAPAVPEVKVTTVKSQKLNGRERLPAELMPYESVDLYAKATGFVKSIKVDRGSKVKQGELLAELEAPELLAQRAQATAAYEGAESQLAAAQAKLSADQGTFQHLSAAAKTPGVVAFNDLEIAQKTVESDEAGVSALQKSTEAAQQNVRAVAQLESYLKITAPFDGQITTRYVHPGTLVGPASGASGALPIVRLETMNRYRLVVPVPENDAADIPQGAEVSFTVPSFPERTFRAPIARVSGDVDTKTRTMPVELDVRDPRGELLPGSFCQVEWPIRRSYPTLFVPTSAVASNLERTFVIRVRNNQTEWVDVKTGAASGNLVEVFGNLQDGETIALKGTDELRAGVRVNPQQADGTTPGID